MTVSFSALYFGSCRNSQGNLATDRLFTGQRLDGTGLYYYGARFYDPTIGRFISADSIVQTLYGPQTLNRYSYVTNNPLRYADPSGHSMLGYTPPRPPGKQDPGGGGSGGGDGGGDDGGGNGGDNGGGGGNGGGSNPPSGNNPGLPVDPNPGPSPGTEPSPSAPPGMPGTPPPGLPGATPGSQSGSAGYSAGTGEKVFEKELVGLWLTFETIHACVPALVGTGLAGSLFLAYAPAAAAGPPGWVAIGVVAGVQVAMVVGGWGTTILLFQHEVIPSWKEYFGQN